MYFLKRKKIIKLFFVSILLTTCWFLLILHQEVLHRPIFSLQLITYTKEGEEFTDNSKPRCKIPVIEPLNSVVKPYISYDKLPKDKKCKIAKKKTYIENDHLIVNLENMKRFEICYIQRIDDFTIDDQSLCETFKLSKDDDGTKENQARCYKELDTSQFIYTMGGNGDVVVAHDGRKCKPDMMFIYKDKKMVHNDSRSCFIPQSYEIHSKIILSASCNKTSEFEFQENGVFKHMASSFCIVYTPTDGKLKLDDCNKASKFYSNDAKSYDVNMTIPIKHEFMKIKYLQDEKYVVEYHAYIFTPKETPDPRHEDQLDVIMIMIDSTSNANAQRHLKKTYEYLENDPNTFIFKGHTINGDGTTAQVGAMLTGIPEKDAPEARRGMPNAKTIDGWPFIFKEFQHKNYKTLYSEDDPFTGTFQYRLKGWDKQPTTHYLRTFFYAIAEQIKQHSILCEPEVALKYLKQYFNVYKNFKKYAFINMGRLAHNEMNNLLLLDDDIFDTYQFLKENGHLENSAIFLFGDHGMRMGSYRATIEGKLEERLPLMSLTLPKSFVERHPHKTENMRRNTEILTTHYDFYRTLKHLANFPIDNANISFARSLFDDIQSLDRSCKDANIDPHWCPCETFEKLSTKDKNVRSITETAVGILNRKITDIPIAKEKCAKLTLKSIKRAGKKSLEKNMQRFIDSQKDNNCDSCGLKIDKDIPLKSSYEIVFVVNPSNGTYEISADVTTVNGILKIVDIRPGMSRTDMYGSQSACISEQFPHLRQYCSCKLT